MVSLFWSVPELQQLVGLDLERIRYAKYHIQRAAHKGVFYFPDRRAVRVDLLS